MKFFQQIITLGLHAAPFLQHAMEIRNVFSGSYSSQAGKHSVDVLERRWIFPTSSRDKAVYWKGPGLLHNLPFPLGPCPSPKNITRCAETMLEMKCVFLRSINSYHLLWVFKEHFTIVPSFMQKYHQVMKPPAQNLMLLITFAKQLSRHPGFHFKMFQCLWSEQAIMEL